MGSHLRQLASQMVSEALADHCYCGYCDVALLVQRGADVVMREHQKRKTDLRRAQRLGRGDHLVLWDKAKRCSEGLEQETFDQWPDQLTLRRVTVHFAQKGRCTRKLTLITTLLDPKAYPAADLGGEVHAALLAAKAQRVLPDRPGRIEPRAIKRRPKPRPLLNVPRSEAREALKGGLSRCHWSCNLFWCKPPVAPGTGVSVPRFSPAWVRHSLRGCCAAATARRVRYHLHLPRSHPSCLQ